MTATVSSFEPAAEAEQGSFFNQLRRRAQLATAHAQNALATCGPRIHNHLTNVQNDIAGRFANIGGNRGNGGPRLRLGKGRRNFEERPSGR
jgi:hypothetical protein